MVIYRETKSAQQSVPFYLTHNRHRPFNSLPHTLSFKMSTLDVRTCTKLTIAKVTDGPGGKDGVINVALITHTRWSTLILGLRFTSIRTPRR